MLVSKYCDSLVGVYCASSILPPPAVTVMFVKDQGNLISIVRY